MHISHHSVLGVDGYAPSIIQYDVPDNEKKPASFSTSSSAFAKPTDSKSSDEKPVAKAVTTASAGVKAEAKVTKSTSSGTIK